MVPTAWPPHGHGVRPLGGRGAGRHGACPQGPTSRATAATGHMHVAVAVVVVVVAVVVVVVAAAVVVVVVFLGGGRPRRV